MSATGSPKGMRPPVAALVDRDGAVLTRTDLRELGFSERAVDAIFRELPIVKLPGFARPMIRADDFRAFVEKCTFHGDRIRPT